MIEFDAPNQGSIEQEIFLPAGDYGFSAEVTANGYIEWGNGLPDGRSEMTASLTQVPEPAGAALAAVVIFGATILPWRKRR